MSSTDLVWWLIAARALFGVPVFATCLRMTYLAVSDAVLVNDRKVNGMVRVIVLGYVRDALFFLVVVGILTGTAFLSWPTIVARGPYGPKQIFGAAFMLGLSAVIGSWKLMRSREYRRLVDMAKEADRAARAVTKAAPGLDGDAA